MSEHLEQVRLVAWFRKTYQGTEHRIAANPNGGGRTKREGAKLKAEGVLPGIPDLFIPTLNLWIEMKDEGGCVSPQQKEMIEWLNGIGHIAVVCYCFDDAKELILREMGRYK